MKFGVKQIGDWGKVGRLVETWDRRFPGTVRAVVRDMADKFGQEFVDRLPDEVGGEDPQYDVVVLEGAGRGVYAEGVAVTGRRGPLGELSDQSIVVGLPKRKGPPVGKVTVADIIMDHGPWVRDLIPMPVDESIIELVALEERQDTVSMVRELNERFWKLHGREMASLGAKPAKEVTVNTETRMDVAVVSLRYELGVGAPSRPHWRPAVEALKRYVAKEAKSGRWARLMFVDRNRDWEKDAVGERVGADDFDQEYGKTEDYVTGIMRPMNRGEK